MKIERYYFILRKTILILLMLTSFINIDAQEKNDKPKGFHYVIIGNVQRGNRIEVSLYIPSEGMDKRKTIKIKNGEFKFEGYSEFVQPATIFFEKAEVKFKGIRYNLNLFLERDTVVLKCKVRKERYAWYRFDDLQILKGNVNRFYQQTYKEYAKTVRYWISADPKIQDSLMTYVYPEIKTKVLDSYEKLYYKCKYDAVALFMLKNIVNSRELFNKTHITKNEKTRLLKFFTNIDTTLQTSNDYQIVKDRIEYLTSGNQSTSLKKVEYSLIDDSGNKIPEFKNFILTDLNGNKKSMEDIIKNSKITILDFWWTGCVPCRKFNRETSKKYDYLKSKGVEIISINCDKTKESWMTSSKKDGINWVNLFAGNNSEIVKYYNIKKFPTMFIFDNNLKLLENHLTKATDVLRYVE